MVLNLFKKEVNRRGGTASLCECEQGWVFSGKTRMRVSCESRTSGNELSGASFGRVCASLVRVYASLVRVCASCASFVRVYARMVRVFECTGSKKLCEFRASAS